MKTMIVNHIPALTWNALQANRAKVEVPEVLDIKAGADLKDLPAGVSVKKLDAAEAAKWLKDHAPAQDPEAVVAGKTPMYHPQTFATGLGAEFDEYMNNVCGKVVLLETEEGAQISDYIVWDEAFSSGAAASAQIIHVAAGSSLTVLAGTHSERSAEGISLVSTKIVLEEGAKLTLVKAQRLGKGVMHFDDLGAALKDNADFALIQMELGGADVYTGAQTELMGTEAQFDAKVGYIAGNEQTVDMNFNAVMRGKKTNCEMTFNGVVDDQATKALRYTIDFRKGARGSVGNERESVLVLSDDAVIKTLPMILCEEENMEGRHGASIGRLDQDMLFYLATRGIDEKEAERIMVRARLDAIARHIPASELKDHVNRFMEEVFGE